MQALSSRSTLDSVSGTPTSVETLPDMRRQLHGKHTKDKEALRPLGVQKVLWLDSRHVLQGAGLRQIEHITAACNQPMLAQMAQHT